MLSKAKFILSNTNKNYLNLKSFQIKKFSTKDVMSELNLTKKEIKELNHLVKSPWVKAGKEKLVNFVF